MQLNKVLKGLLIAVPVMTLAACSSSSDIDEGAANQSNQSAVEQSTNTDTVEVATIPALKVCGIMVSRFLLMSFGVVVVVTPCRIG